jgi:hypothetical protein
VGCRLVARETEPEARNRALVENRDVNEQQGLVRLKNVLRSLRWGSTGDPAFGKGNIKITAGLGAEALGRLGNPCALIRPGGSGLRDPEGSGDDAVYKQSIGLTLVMALPGDQFGEAPLLGGFRAGGATDGDFRGLLDLQGLVIPAIHELGPKDGFVIAHVSSSIPEATLDENRGYVVARSYQLDGYFSAEPGYEVPADFAASVAGATVSLSWATPHVSTDLIKYTLRRVSGSLPVIRPTEGTAVSLAAALSTSKDDTPGSGTWTYSLFAMYAEPGGTVGRYYTDMLDVTVTVA